MASAGAKKVQMESLVVTEVVEAPRGVTIEKLRASVSMSLKSFSSLRVTYGKGDGKISVLPMEQINISSIVTVATSASGPSQQKEDEAPLDPSSGKLFTLCLIKGSSSMGMSCLRMCGTGNDDGGQVQKLKLRVHSIAADYASVRIFLLAVLSNLSASNEGISAFGGMGGAKAEDLWKVAAKESNIIAAADKGESKELKYWSSVIDDTAPVVQLNADLSRPLEKSLIARRVAEMVPPELAAKVDALAKEVLGGDHHSARMAVYAAAFAVLIYRRSLEEDLVISTCLDPRSSSSSSSSSASSSAEGVFGPLSQQAYLRIAVEDNKSFEVLAKAVAKRLEEAKKNLGLPFEEIAQKLLESDEKAAMLPEDSRFSPVEFVMDKSPYRSLCKYVASSMELRVRVTDVGGDQGTMLAVEYQEQLFHPLTAADTLSQYILVLSQITKGANGAPKSLMHISLVTPRARRLVPSPTSPLNAGWEGSIAACFDKSAARVPERTAIVFEGKKISYETLQKLVDAVCSSLLSAGIQKGDVVGLYGHRSPAVVWAIMGILKAGAAYTMMDPKYPRERIELCLGIAGIKAFIHLEAAGKLDPKLQKYLENKKLSLCGPLPADPDPEAVLRLLKPNAKAASANDAKTSSSNPPSIDPWDVAVVTFTSGSTGIPKGVQGRHASLTHFYPWMAERFGIREDDRFSMCSGIAHDPLQRDIFTPLFFGAAIHIPTDLDIAEPGRLARWTHKEKITISCFTPAMGQLLVSGDKASAPVLSDFRLAFFVGAMLVKRDVQMLRALAPNVRVINMYGSTETQRAVGYLEIVSANEEAKGAPTARPSAQSHATAQVPIKSCKEVIPVGIGMQDGQMLAINKAGIIAGIGEMAEIYMRSPHIALGYIGKPEVTKARFLPNPFGGTEAEEKDGDQRYGKLGDRMYKTGDLGRYRYDGFVECCGRADDQIKIRGFRVELGEINATLSQCPGLQDNIVIAVDDTIGSKMLVGYLVAEPKPGVPPPKPLPRGAKPIVRTDDDAPALALKAKKFLSKRLPHYMVPTFFVVLEALPLTANGKINTRALPPPERRSGPQGGDGDGEDPATHKKYKGKLTDTEKALVRAWSDVLKVHAPGLDEGFFDLGGHSLAATQLTLQMREALPHLSIPMDLLFRHPTIKALAAALDNDDGDEKQQARQQLNLAAEAENVAKECLKDVGTNVNKNGICTTPLSEATGVLLTGATGFLGAFLARELLRRTSPTTTIFCAARGRDLEAVEQRVRNNLRNHCIDLSDEDAKRLRPVVCDLSKPLLGMEAAAFETLAQKVQAIVHNGAYVHWLLPYDRLKPTNVLGTHAVLKLASLAPKIAAVHYVSTTSVFDDAHHAKQATVAEDDTLQEWKGLSGGYPQSKWMAERLLMAAAKDAGVPVAIYRPGYVTGDCEKGLWNTDDFQVRLIKGCIQLGACPFMSEKDTDGRLIGLDASPVDYVAEAIVHIAGQVEFSKGKEGDVVAHKAFNIVNPSPYPYAALYNKLASFGYKIEAIPYEKWRQRLQEAVRGSASGGSKEANPLAAVITNFSEGWAAGLPNPSYDMKNANALLANSKSNIKRWSDEEGKVQQRSIACPSIDELVQVYLAYLIACEFLPKPPSGSAGDKVDWAKMCQGVARLSRSNRT